MDELKQEVRDTVGLVLVVARETEGLSPADLKAVAQEAALAAMSRTRGGQSRRLRRGARPDQRPRRGRRLLARAVSTAAQSRECAASSASTGPTTSSSPTSSTCARSDR